MVGKISDSSPRPLSRWAASWAQASAMMPSVRSGRWGPCASTAPMGNRTIQGLACTARTSSQVISASGRIGMNAPIIGP